MKLKQGDKPGKRAFEPIKEVTSVSQGGLKYETIVRSFISSHVMQFCETLCYKAWDEAQKEHARLLEVVEEAEDGEKPADKSTEKQNDGKFEALFNKRLASLKGQMRPRCEESFAAVVMADVSGYSNLSSTLAEKGAEGAEILSKTMKGYLDKV